jgi:MFS family permease
LQTIIATAIPRITDQFHSLDQIGWYGSAFFLTLASFQSAWGKVYKFFPLKPAFLCAIVIFELGSLICGKPFSKIDTGRETEFKVKVLLGTAACSLLAEL